MLARDVLIDGFDTPDWTALLRIANARATRRAPHGGAASGGLVVVTAGGRVTKVLSTTRGRLPLAAAAAVTTPLEALCREHGAAWGMRAERGALRELVERFSERVERPHDYLEQLQLLVGAAVEAAARGALEVHPPGLESFDARVKTADRVLDLVCPAGKTLFFAAFEGGEVETSLGLHRGPHGIDRVVGPALLRHDLGLRSGDWARDSAGLARAAELSIGSLSLGCFAQTRTWCSLLGGDAPGAWASAVAAREVVFHPLSPAIAIPLGVDVGRAAIAVARDLAVRFGVDAFIRDLVLGARPR